MTLPSAFEETVDALRALLSSKDELKSIMRLRETAAQSFIDLLDDVRFSIP